MVSKNKVNTKFSKLVLFGTQKIKERLETLNFGKNGAKLFQNVCNCLCLPDIDQFLEL